MGRRFTPRRLPADDGRAYLDAALTEARHEAVVTVEAPADKVADRLKFADCEVEPLSGDRCRVTAFVDPFPWLIIDLGLLEADFRIHTPAEFADLTRQLAERLLRAGSEPAV